MFVGGMLLGFTLIGFAFWLHWNEQLGWPGDTSETDLDRDYLRRRYRARRWMHWLFAVCGLLIMAAAWGGPESKLFWIGCWTVVMITLLTIIILAAFDVLRTQRYQSKKLPEIRRQTLDQE